MKRLVSNVGVCRLYATVTEKGLIIWDMYSPFTGNHSILTEKYDERVVNHWNGFVDNQPEVNYIY